MGNKVFVSYKYKDYNVAALSTTQQPPTWPCDYVDYIQKYVLSHSDVYKGEKATRTFPI